MDSVNKVNSSGAGLNNIAKEHENNLVIDRSFDRLTKWIGVYFFTFLAVIVKLVEITEQKVRCFPANATATAPVNRDFINFADAYCWKTTQEITASACVPQDVLMQVHSSVQSLENPVLLKWMYLLLPYLLLLQAILFVIPSVWWYFGYGAQLLCHLKFFQLLLNNIFTHLQGCERLKFNENKTNDNRKAKKSKKVKSSGCKRNRPTGGSDGEWNGTLHEGIDEEQTPLVQNPDDTFTNDPERGRVTESSNNAKRGFWEKILVGSYLTDKNFLSLLCYENLASLENYIYVLTVGEVKDSEHTSEPEPDNADKMYVAAILEQWCINSGFESTKYLKPYMIKQIVTAVLALLFSVAIIILIGFMSSDMSSSDIFGCQLPYEDAYMLCSIQQTRDIFAVFVCNAACTFAIAILSITNWLLVRRMRCRNTLSPEARYFEKLEKVTGAVSKLMLSLKTTAKPLISKINQGPGSTLTTH